MNTVWILLALAALWLAMFGAAPDGAAILSRQVSVAPPVWPPAFRGHPGAPGAATKRPVATPGQTPDRPGQGNAPTKLAVA